MALIGLVGLGWLASAGGARAASPGTPASPTTTTTASTATTATTKAPTDTTSTTLGRTTSTTSAKSTTTTTRAPTGPTTTTPTVPPAAIAAMIALANSVKLTPPSSDQGLLGALAPLEKLGYTAQQAYIMGMGQFPVAGAAYYTDDWLQYRPTPSPHNHMGIDVLAAMGTPIRAPIAGTLTYNNSDPDGYGLTAEVTQPDKTYYVMAHMSATVVGLATGAQVTQGEVVGFVGESGDATGPHVHFEVHPLGGAGVNGKPMLDAWLAAAIKAAPALITSIENGSTTTTTTAVPLQVAHPAPQAALSPTQAFPTTPISTPAGSLIDLELAGLATLFIALNLALLYFRPWPFSLSPVTAAGPDAPPGDRPTPAR